MSGVVVKLPWPEIFREYDHWLLQNLSEATEAGAARQKLMEIVDRHIPSPPSASTEEVERVLQLILDQVDYTSGKCAINEMIAACLPKEILYMARQALTRSIPEKEEGKGDE